MQIDVRGKVREKKLAYRNTLLPLFEAVVNSIHSIEDINNRSSGKIEIEIIRSRQSTIESEESKSLAPVIDFVITDNGIGFNDQNYESFNYAYSTHKLKKGGKGIGRITWLRAFEKIKIESFYSNNGTMMKRTFDFKRSKIGIENHHNVPLKNGTELGRLTKVHLKFLKPEYQRWCNYKLEEISFKVIQHCFTYFLDEDCPKIIIKDQNQKQSLNDLFKSYLRKSVDNQEIKVRDYSFSLDIVKFSNIKLDNKIHYTAYKRVVVSERITDYIPELQTSLKDEHGEKVSIDVYVSGKYLDDHVNEERTEIGFSKETFFPDDLKQEDLRNEVINAIRNKFKDHIESLWATRIERVEKFIHEKNPRYRCLLKYRKEALNGISPHLPDNKFEIELFKIQKDLEKEVFEEASDIIKAGEDLEQKEKFKLDYSNLYNKITEVGKAKLSEYIIHRKLVLDLLETHLKKHSSGKYSKEKLVHDLIFPLKKTSDEIKLEEHNLWVIDERLAFHDYLASDKAFEAVELTSSDSQKRADLLIFNKSHVLNEDDKPYSSIVIVEFKRPMRKDYSYEDNPINQITSYVREIMDNKVLDKNGKQLDIKENTPLYAYIICDLTPKLRQICKDYDYTLSPDNDGYFNFIKNYNLYVEVISFDKLILDSRKRNTIFFDKLNIPS